VDAHTIAALVPILRTGAGYIESAIFDTAGARLDGHALLQGFLAGMRAAGGRVITNRSLERARHSDGLWIVDTANESFAAPVLINAAGAWADEVARRAGLCGVGLVPKRRTVVTFDGPPGVDVAGWPFVRSIDESLYFTPESGALLLSPADETPSEPCDAQPDELDVATAVDRFEHVTTMQVPRLRSRWAGLRTFAPDRAPVVGFDPAAPGFFWFAGQGGVGLQTAPALSELGESLITRRPIPARLAAYGMDAHTLSPARLRV
jgi:D-arginine dehydrogenase